MSAPSNTSPSNFNNLPTEILSAVVDLLVDSCPPPYLDTRNAQRQLACLCSVSRALLPVAREHLYHTIRFELRCRSGPSSSQRDESVAAPTDLHSTFPILRTLDRHPHLTNYVRRVAFFQRSSGLLPAEMQLPEMAQLLQLCPHLVEARLCFLNTVGMDLSGILVPLNASRRKLRRLWVGEIGKAEQVRGEKGLRRALATFFDVQTEVEELSMWGFDGHLSIATEPPAWRLHTLTTNSSSFAHLAHHSTTTLRRLHLLYNRRDPASPSPLDLTSFTALQSLTLDDDHFSDKMDPKRHLQAFFPLCPPSLTTLHICHTSFIEDPAHVDPLLPSLPPTLLHLDLRGTSASMRGLSAMLSEGSISHLETVRYARPVSLRGREGAEAAEHEEAERQLIELGSKQGVRVIPTDEYHSL